MIDFGLGVRLTTVEMKDAQMLREWRNDPCIWAWCRQNDLISEQEQVEWIERQRKDPSIRMYVIEDVNSNAVGVCGLTSIDRYNRRAEFSLYIGPEKQRMGFAKKALSTLLSHGFQNLGLNVIWGETFDENPALEIFKGLGFQVEGRRRDFYWKRGRFIGATLVSITGGEWLQHLQAS